MHSYFDDLRNKDSKIYTDGIIIPDLFDFSKGKIRLKYYRGIIELSLIKRKFDSIMV